MQFLFSQQFHVFEINRLVSILSQEISCTHTHTHAHAHARTHTRLCARARARARVCVFYIKPNADNNNADNNFYLEISKEIPSIRNDKTITIESADSINIEFISIVDILEILKELILVR